MKDKNIKALKEVVNEYKNTGDSKPKVMGNTCGGGGGGTTYKIMCSPGCDKK